MKNLLLPVLLCLTLAGCIESPGFYRAEAKWNAAYADCEKARKDKDYPAMREAFSREIDAIEEEAETCWFCTKERWRAWAADMRRELRGLR